jgi:hypothetical protein
MARHGELSEFMAGRGSGPLPIRRGWTAAINKIVGRQAVKPVPGADVR